MLANMIYLMALAAASPLILYRVLRHGRYRRGVGEKLLGLSKQRASALCQETDCIWIHAVSVGEVNLLPGVVRHLQAAMPKRRIVVSSSTDTGYDLAVRHFGTENVFFCPLDFTWAVQRTLRHLKPTHLILAELELWPNLIRTARSRGCRVSVINARLSERSSRRYQQFGWITRPIFRNLSLVACQDAECSQRFAACGTPTDRLRVTGSIKFDDAPTSRDTPEVQDRLRWSGIQPEHRVWIVGSTQAGEEMMALQIFRSLRTRHPELRLILVPRHKERFDEVAELVVESGLAVRRRSDVDSNPCHEWHSETVLLIDTIGELRHWWGVGQIATVGGSFCGGRGGQNMLEPAGYGCALSFGPDTRNFAGIADRLVAEGGAIRTRDQDHLQDFVEQCLNNLPAAESLGRSAQKVVLDHRGATQRTIDALCGDLNRQVRAA